MLGDALLSLSDALVDAIKYAFQWFFNDVIKPIAGMLMQIVLGLLPADITNYLDLHSATLIFAFECANAWIPIDYALTLGAWLVSVYSPFLSIKILIKLIP